MSVLSILKCSDCGLTEVKLREKAAEEGIHDPSDEVGKLIAEGLVHFDEHPEPGRYKATPKAFNN